MEVLSIMCTVRGGGGPVHHVYSGWGSCTSCLWWVGVPVHHVCGGVYWGFLRRPSRWWWSLRWTPPRSLRPGRPSRCSLGPSWNTPRHSVTTATTASSHQHPSSITTVLPRPHYDRHGNRHTLPRLPASVLHPTVMLSLHNVRTRPETGVSQEVTSARK